MFAPTLKDENTHGLSDHIAQICNLIIENDLRDFILVGHSYGGMIITGVANKMADKIVLLVYLDAALPNPGQSLFDILILANFAPVEVVRDTPKAYIEKLQFDPQKTKSLPKAFIFCTKSEYASVISSDLIREKIAENKGKWEWLELPTSHIPQCTMPDKLSELLLKLGKAHQKS